MKGFKVIAMTDPEKAYFWAEKNKPDLVISDVAMPGIDGFTLIRNLKANKPTENIFSLVMLTATDKVSDVEKGFDSGARAYILKPIDWDRAWAKLQPFLLGTGPYTFFANANASSFVFTTFPSA